MNHQTDKKTGGVKVIEILEFGDRDKRKTILIHGFQSPYQVLNPYIEHYKRDFCVIVPIMPGHNPNQEDDFISFSETAEELEEHFISRYGKDVYAVYGMSMGGVLSAALWRNKRLAIEKVIFDGSPLIGVNTIMKKMMFHFYLDITRKAQQRDKKTLEQAAKSICPPQYLNDFLRVLDNMSDTTVINSIKDIANFRLPNDIHTPNTKIYFYHGTAVNEMLARRSAKFISRNYPNSSIKCFSGKGHCETALFSPETMIQELDHIL